MPLILTDTVGLSNLVKREHPWMESDGYGIEIATTTAAMGQVVENLLGVWTAITAIPAPGSVVGVVLDATKEDSTKKRILVKGEAIVADAALVYFTGATAQDKLDTNAFLEAVDIQVNKAI